MGRPSADDHGGGGGVSIFRQEALEARRMPEEAETLEVSPPWTWILFLGLGGLLLVFLIWAIFGRVPVTERGRGLLQPVGGARALVATVSGRVGAVRARNGQFVKTGDVILEIEAPSVAGPALVAERDKTLAETDLIRLTANEERTYREQRQRVEDRTRSAQEQLVSLDKSAEMQARKVLASERLYNAELLTTLQVDDAKEAMENIRRQQQQTRQAIVALKQERATLDAQNEDRALLRKRDLARVQATAEGQSAALGQSVVVATADGVVEGLQANRGDSIQIGDEMGRVIPEGAALEVVAFLPERHQAFVREGEVAYLEIDQLPYGEFGSAKARVKRVGRGTASPRELQTFLGNQTATVSTTPAAADVPMVRVELDILDQKPAQKAGVSLKAGMRTQVRFKLRRQSLMAMLIAPLRRWLD